MIEYWSELSREYKPFTGAVLQKQINDLHAMALVFYFGIILAS